MNDLAGAAAARAGARGLEHAEGRALLGADGAGALAVRADLRRGAGGTAGTLAVRALIDASDVDLLLAAERSLLKGDGQPHAQALAPLRSRAGRAPGGCAAEAAEAEAAEDVPEDVAQIPEVPGEPPGARAVIGVHAGEAELVVLGLLVGIGQDGIGLVRLFEAGFRSLIVGMEIRMALLGDASICFFYVVVRGALRKAEDLVVIAFICHAITYLLCVYAPRGGTNAPPAAQ